MQRQHTKRREGKRFCPANVADAGLCHIDMGKSVVNSLNNCKTMSERKHKHFNINESGVDTRKSNMKKGRFLRGKKELCLQEGKSVNNDEGSC